MLWLCLLAFVACGDSLEYAIQFGRDNGQIAVFILSKGQELKVK